MSFVLPRRLKRSLHVAAEQMGISASQIIRVGIKLALREIKKTGKLPGRR